MSVPSVMFYLGSVAQSVSGGKEVSLLTTKPALSTSVSITLLPACLTEPHFRAEV